MTYYIFKEQIFTIFLSMAHLTAVSFPEKVHDYVGGQEGDYKIYELNKGRSLVFEAKRKSFDRNFITFLKETKYHFNLTYNEDYSNKDIVIKPAQKCSYYTLLKETAGYKLFECPKSLYFVNTTKAPVKLNELVVSTSKYLSKGPSIYLNGTPIYKNGRAI